MSQSSLIGGRSTTATLDRSPRLTDPSGLTAGLALGSLSGRRQPPRWEVVLLALVIAAVALLTFAVASRLGSVVNSTIGGEQLFPVVQPGPAPVPLQP